MTIFSCVVILSSFSRSEILCRVQCQSLPKSLVKSLLEKAKSVMLLRRRCYSPKSCGSKVIHPLHVNLVKLLKSGIHPFRGKSAEFYSLEPAKVWLSKCIWNSMMSCISTLQGNGRRASNILHPEQLQKPLLITKAVKYGKGAIDGSLDDMYRV